jgi:integrase
MGKLTPLQVKQAKSDKSKEIRIADGNGLFLRVRQSGAKSWLYCFRMPGSRTLQQMTIGTVGEYSLSEAREKRLQFRKLIKEGLDPRKIRAAEITQNTEAITVQKLFEFWIAFLKERKAATPKWLKAHEGRWKNHFKDALGNILARDITQEHLAKTLDAMSSKGIREETRKSLTMLNKMFEYGKTRHLIKENHARILKPKDFSVSASPPRERALSIEELRKLWLVLDSSRMNIITATALKILILTGARRGEVVAMKWSEIDVKNATWQIPASKVKNRKSHIIFLSSLTLNLLESLISITGQSSHVFNTQLNSRGHIHTDALTRALRRLMKHDKSIKINADKEKNNPPLSNMENFTVHDIRRSVATNCAEVLKISPHVIERMLNHQPLNKMVRTYQRATYAEEQKQAWLEWGNTVEHKIANEPTNIIPFKNKKAI